jgi:hypothetical protein
MASGCRRRRHAFAVAGTLGAFVFATTVAAFANEPTDLRIISATRHGATVELVVSVPARFVPSASGPGAITLTSSSGQTIRPTVTALAPSTSGVAIVLDLSASAPATVSRVQGLAAELVRSLPPGTRAALVTSKSTTPAAALTSDLAALFPALARASGGGKVPLESSARTALGQLRDPRLVDPVVVVVDGGTAPATAAKLPALGSARVEIIPVGAAPSPAAKALASATGVSIVGAADPVAAVDTVVGNLQGRYRLTAPDPGAGKLTVHLRVGSQALDAATTLVAAPVATTAPTTPVATVATAAPTVASTAAVAPARPPATTASSSSHRDWLAVIGLVLVLAGATCVVLMWPRRRAKAPQPAPLPVTVRRAPAAQHPGTSTRIRVTRTYVAPSAHVRNGSSAPAAQPAAEPVSAVEEPPAPEEPASNGKALGVFEKRVRVLTLAAELGNVSEACRIVGVSRRSFYTWKRIADEQGIEALDPRRTGPADGA